MKCLQVCGEICRNVVQHYLNISPKTQPVKQRPHKFFPYCQLAISDEVNKLLGAGFSVKVQCL